MATETKLIRLSLDARDAARQLDQINKNMNATRKAAQGLQTSFGRLNRVAGLLLGGSVFVRGLQNLTQLNDTYKELSALVNIQARETVGLESAMTDLTEIALRNYTALDAVGTLYARTAQTTRDLGLSHQDTLEFVEKVAQTFRLSGSTAKEAQGAMIQLSQGLSTLNLGGDEFRSVWEGNRVLIQKVAEAMGLTTGQLKQLSQEQLLSPKAFIEATLAIEGLGEEVEGLPVTVSRALTNLQTAFSRFLVVVEKMLGPMQGLAKIINSITSALLSLSESSPRFAFGEELEKNRERAQALREELDRISGSGRRARQRRSLVEGQITALEAVDPDITRQRLLDNISRLEESRGGRRGRNRSASNAALAQEKLLLAELEKQVNSYNKAIEKSKPIAPPVDLTDYNKRIESLQDEINLINGRTVAMQQGKKTLAAFNIEQRVAKVETDLLNEAKEKNITLTADQVEAQNELLNQYRDALREEDRVQRALKDREKEAKSLAVAFGETLAQATNTAADAMVDFAVRGEGSIQDLTQTVLESIAKMLVQFALMRAFFGPTGNTGVIGSYFPIGPTTESAQGNAFSGGNVVPFARGGIVNQPTLFPMAQGAGLMGEAGPEAVVPLTRTASGDLGVKASGGTVVNINNYGNDNVSVDTEQTAAGLEIVNIAVGEVDRRIMTGGSTWQAISHATGARRAATTQR